MSRRFMYPLAVAAAAVIPGLSAPAALASAGPDRANCQYSGSAATSGIAVNGNNSSLPNEVPNNTGTYNFTQFTFTCVGTDQSDPTESTAGVINVNSSGNYTNQTCGTGSAVGTASGAGPTPDLTVSASNYNIQFTAGEGILAGSGTNGEGDAFNVLGSTSIIATGGSNATTGTTPNQTWCTDNFEVLGAAQFTTTTDND